MSDPSSRLVRIIRLLAGLLGLSAAGVALVFKSACSLLWHRPDQYTQAQRMAQLPKGPAPVTDAVIVYWDEHAIPFIEAKRDEDLAFALGVIHGHLRIDQIELFRLLAKGELSSVVGPIGPVTKLDHALRLLDFERAGQAALKGMAPQSLAWMEHFTRGLNWYIASLHEDPVTHRLLDLEPKPFTLLDVAMISRLVSSDLSWATYIKHLRLENPARFQEFLAKLGMDLATDSPFDLKHAQDGLFHVTRSGSNSVVVAGSKTKSGAGMIASDPHVGLFLPNFWLLVGMKSPSYHAVGLMIPGLPILGEGRNMHVAWGGTNMRGISSHLYDVSSLDARQFRTEKHKIPRRRWFAKEIEIRHSPFGNVISDIDFSAPRFASQTFALDWLGHEQSDEIGAFLAASKAQDWQQFESAFQDYRVSAMNMLYADSAGHIGMVAAYGQPRLKDPSKTLDLIKYPDNPRKGVIAPPDHPNPYDPPQGFLASANNKPFADPEIPIAYNFSNNDRFVRLSELIEQHEQVTVQDLQALQQDSYCASSVALKSKILASIEQKDMPARYLPTFELLSAWDGRYDRTSGGAVVFHALMHELWQQYCASMPKDFSKYWQGTDRWKSMLLGWLQGQAPAKISSMVLAGLEQAAKTSQKFRTWGDFTVMTPQVPLGRLPVIGGRFRRPYAAALDGSSDTINKYGRSLSLEKAEVSYGASARHISDLADPDANYFVLNGGQDGWIFNENIDDQIRLWQQGQYIQVPLRMSSVQKAFRAHVTRWLPASTHTPTDE